MVRAGLGLILALAAGAASADCRQAIAIGLDVSASVDRAEYALQRNGMVAALLDPEVRAAILQMPEAPVWLTVYEWSNASAQRVLVPWAAMTDAATLDRFAATLSAAPGAAMPPGTAVGSAMVFGLMLLGQRSDCWTLTLDLAGDGRSNGGPFPLTVDPVAGGEPVTINALAIGLPEGPGASPGVAELSAYFRAEVIRGPGAFVEVALGHGDFAAAMTRKLLKELEGITVGGRALPDDAGDG